MIFIRHLSTLGHVAVFSLLSTALNKTYANISRFRQIASTFSSIQSLSWSSLGVSWTCHNLIIDSFMPAIKFALMFIILQCLRRLCFQRCHVLAALFPNVGIVVMEGTSCCLCLGGKACFLKPVQRGKIGFRRCRQHRCRSRSEKRKPSSVDS